MDVKKQWYNYILVYKKSTGELKCYHALSLKDDIYGKCISLVWKFSKTKLQLNFGNKR